MLWRTCALSLFIVMALSQEVPTVQLNNGISMPALALGTYLGIDQVIEQENDRFPGDEVWRSDWVSIIRESRKEKYWNPAKYSVACSVHFDAKDLYANQGGPRRVVKFAVPKKSILESKDIVRSAILRAIETGYRHIDTAAIYETEVEIGAALKSKFESGEVKREDIFVTTKLWNTKHKREEVPQALRESLQKLRLEYADLYLMHWPIGLNADYTFSDVDFMETWSGLEDVLSSGLTRAIGVSNFNREQLTRLLAEGRVPPAVLQIEVHPNMVQTDLISFSQAHNITVMGYSPLGTTVPRFGATFPGLRMDDPGLLEIAGRHGKTSAQVLLRWQVDRNIVPVVKSLNPRRLKENISIFDFKLSDAELKSISSNSSFRLIAPTFWQDHKDYPFEKVEQPVANPFKPL